VTQQIAFDFGCDLVSPVSFTVICSLVSELKSLLLVLVQCIATRHV
jgi:hypothetical protein